MQKTRKMNKKHLQLYYEQFPNCDCPGQEHPCTLYKLFHSSFYLGLSAVCSLSLCPLFSYSYWLFMSVLVRGAYIAFVEEKERQEYPMYVVYTEPHTASKTNHILNKKQFCDRQTQKMKKNVKAFVHFDRHLLKMVTKQQTLF